MSPLLSNGSSKTGLFLSRAYQRIRRITIALDILAVVVANAAFGWRTGVGVTFGAIVSYLNLLWLHRGTQILTERMLAASSYSKSRVVLAFLGRLVFMIAAGYVTFKSSAEALYGFLAALALPVAGLMCEGVYEAFVGRNTSEI